MPLLGAGWMAWLLCSACALSTQPHAKVQGAWIPGNQNPESGGTQPFAPGPSPPQVQTNPDAPGAPRGAGH